MTRPSPQYAFPPRRLRPDAAAYYLGVGKTKLLEEVEKGNYPRARWSEGRLQFWDRVELDQWMDNEQKPKSSSTIRL